MQVDGLQAKLLCPKDVALAKKKTTTTDRHEALTRENAAIMWKKVSVKETLPYKN